MRLKKLGGIAAVALMLGAAAPALAVTAPLDQTFNFTGNCSDCSGSVTASLTVQDYVEGIPLSDNNLVSFTYSGSNLMPGGFTLVTANDNDSLGFFHDFLSGSITSKVGFYQIDVGQTFGGAPDAEFTSFTDGSWNVSQAEVTFDQGTSGLWNGDATTISAAPEPGAWALMMLGVGMIGAMFGRRKRLIVGYKAKLAAIG